MSRVSIYIIYLMSWWPAILMGQPINQTFGDVTLPSYAAASLGKFGEIPVSYFTGVPGIGVDVYTVKQGPLVLPISVNYHASGVKVAEVASWVGCGWTLQAGGMISRSVVGIPDEGPNGWFSKSTTAGIPLQQVAEGSEDSEPDMFHFSVLGYSGKFIFDLGASTSPSVEPMLIPRQDIKITRQYSGSNLIGFKLILPDGVVCYFGAYGGSSAVETSAPLPSAATTTTGWYLMRIETHDAKHAISLSYATERYSYRYPASAEYYSMLQASSCLTSGSSGTKYLSIYDNPVAFNFVVGKRLSNISNSAATTSVDFVTNSSDLRTDVDAHGSQPALPLDKIEIHHGSFEKVFDFSYDYFSSPADPHDIANGTTTSSWYKRLRLVSIQEQSGDGTMSKPPYVFTYAGINSIPQRLCRAIDHWGLANGAALNGVNAVNIPATKVGNATYGSSNRDSDGGNMQYGMLSRITYPTKGYTDYTFGPNRYHYPAGNSPYFEEKTAITSCYVGGGPTCCTTAVTTGSVFTLTAAEIADAEVAMDIRLGENSPSNCANAPRWINLTLYTAGGVAIDNVSFGEGPNEPYELPGIRFALTDPVLGFGPIAAGDYYFTLETDNGFGNAELYVKEAIEKDVGGMRIEAITHYDAQGSVLDKRTFDYTKAGSNESSAVLYVEPVYGSQVYDTDNLYHLFWRDHSVVALSGFDGYHVGYERVVEIRDNNGSTEYLFNAESRTPVLTYPQIPDEFIVRNGQLDEVNVYHQNGTKVAGTTNTYTSAYEYLGANPFKVFSFRHPNAGFGNACFYSRVSIYDPRTGYNLIAVESNFADGMQSSTNYEYNPADQLEPTAQYTVNSDGKLHRTTYDYAAAISNTTIRNTLLDQNRILPTWRTRNYVDGIQVDGKYHTFSFFNSNGDPTPSSTALLYPRQEWRYEYTWDAAGTPAVIGWKLQRTYDKVQVNTGMPGEITVDGWSDKISLEWTLSGMLAKHAFLAHQKEYTYKAGSDLLDVFTQVDNTTLTYQWDKLMRLKSVTDSKGVSTELDYFYKSGSQPNRLDRKTTYPDFGSLSNHSLTTTTFFDDLGKEIQHFRWKQHPANASQSIAEQTVYDALARPVQRHEPLASTASPSSYAPALTDYTQTTYEASPLARPSEILPPQDLGSTILGKVTYQYSSNGSNEVYDYDSGQYYPANSLHVVTSTDGNGVMTRIYTDILGNEVLIRKTKSSNTANTYKLYDAKNRLTTIYPPGVTNSSQNLHFRLLYSGDDQLVSQDDPDQGVEQFYYDDRELLTARQDAKMASQGKYYRIIRDAYGRSDQEGFSTAETGAITDLLIDHTYGNSGVEIDKLIAMQKKLLDGNQYITTQYEYDAFGRQVVTRSNSVLHTGVHTVVDSLILDDADQILEAWHKVPPEGVQVKFGHTYDHAGRATGQDLQVFTPEGSWPVEQVMDRSYTVKELLSQLRLGVASGTSQLQKIDYTYRDNRYLRGINATMESSDLFAMELGYENHVAGNVTGQVPRQNGDISEWEWRYRLSSGAAGPWQAYRYKYNFVDMLTEAYYFESGKNNHYTTTYGYRDHRGNFEAVTRRRADVLIDDLIYVQKSGSNLIEEIDDESTSILGYKESTGYSYDANGFLSYDPEGDATLTRDHLNHLQAIDQPTAQLTFARDALGQLHRTSVDAQGERTDLDRLGPCEFRNGVLSVIHHDHGYVTFNRPVPETLSLTGTTTTTKTEQAASIRSERTIQPSGNETNEASDQIELDPDFEVALGAQYTATISDFPIQSLSYHYVIKDHLGSPRVVFEDKNNNDQIDFATEIEDIKNHYPFGLEWDAPTQELPRYRNAYNDKERTPYTKYLDFGARDYIKTANIFMGPDPIASSFPHVTTINYAENSPVSNIDLHGLQKMSFLATMKEKGFIKAVGDHFNVGSLISGSGSSDDAVQAVTVIHQGNKVFDNVLTNAEEGLLNVADQASNVEMTALAITGTSGGTTTPVTGPVATGAAGVEMAALIGAGMIHNARTGQFDSNTFTTLGIKVLFGGTSTLVGDGVKALKIGGSHSKQTEDAVEAMGNLVNETAEEAAKKKINE